MERVAQSTGWVASGDVRLFYRHFGRPGGTPILIHHGANYYDSADWIEIARELAVDREVAVYDARGYANSTWSPSKNYSIDAALEDSLAVLDHLGWKDGVLLGHSRGGGIVIFLASSYPQRCRGVVVVDRPLHLPLGRFAPRDGKPAVGRPMKVYPTIEDALSQLSRSRDVAPGTKAGARLEEFLKPVQGGFAIPKWDPDRSNTIPIDCPGWKSNYEHDDLWPALEKVTAPILVIRGTRSDRFPPRALERLARDFPQIQRVDVPSGHDVAAEAPVALVQHVSRFVRQNGDGTV
jgi:esterase